MLFKERINLLIALGNRLDTLLNSDNEIFTRVQNANPWFTTESVKTALTNIRIHFLDEAKLVNWLPKKPSIKAKTIGIIMAGNIPLVGFHDFLASFILGHKALIKLSSKDELLMPFILNEMLQLNSAFEPYFEFVERLKEYDAIIATGSDDSKRYFTKYFSHVPHILRGHRNAVGVVFKENTVEDLKGLGKDVFQYFGLGCRNVSKLYLEEGVQLDTVFKALHSYQDIINHHKYKNNYDYSNALYLLNQEEYYTNNFLILRPSDSLNSRISVLHYQYFKNENDLKSLIEDHRSQIQCAVSSKPLTGISTIPMGQAQQPELTDYADNIDTLSFLKNL